MKKLIYLWKWELSKAKGFHYEQIFLHPPPPLQPEKNPLEKVPWSKMIKSCRKRNTPTGASTNPKNLDLSKNLNLIKIKYWNLKSIGKWNLKIRNLKIRIMKIWNMKVQNLKISNLIIWNVNFGIFHGFWFYFTNRTFLDCS